MKEGPQASRKTYHSRIPDARIAIITAEWNAEITSTLAVGARDFLYKMGLEEAAVESFPVSGAFELPTGVKFLLDTNRFDAIIAIGCLVKGDTPHFEYISEVVSHRLSELSVAHTIPIGFGLLTVNTYEQAQQRAGGSHGNKGEEAAEAVLNLLDMRYHLQV